MSSPAAYQHHHNQPVAFTIAVTKPADSPLTMREHQVARALVEGATCREIADALGISVKTVDTHRLVALRKLQCRNAVTLCHYFVARGWVQLAMPAEAARAAGAAGAEDLL